MSETLRVESGGVGLHVEVEGPEDATPVVFLHGVTGSGRSWEWLPEELKRGRRIVRVDFRGHGRSEHKAGTYGLADYGGDVVAVLQELGGEPAVLVGHSLGGVVAWWVTQNHPELVRATFLEDPPLFFGDGSPPPGSFEAAFKGLRANAQAFQEGGLSEEEIAERMGAAPMGPPGAPTMREVLYDDAVDRMAFAHKRMDLGVVDGAIDGSTLLGADTRAPVSRPVFLLKADDAIGAAFTDEHAREFAAAHPEITIERVSGSGHGIHDGRGHRETFAVHLQRFLDEHAPAG